MAVRSVTLGLSLVLGLAACGSEDSKPPSGGDDSGTLPPPVSPGPPDMDLDGMTEEDGDCDDLNPGVYEGAPEACDGIDNNCNGEQDEGLDRTFYADNDADGFGNVGSTLEACKQRPGYILAAGDCDDDDAAIHPGAAEVCDDADVDEDCDSLSDLDDPDLVDAGTFYTDDDGDGYGVQGDVGVVTCDAPSGTATNAYDCDDTNAAVNPNMLEVCDGLALDDDCDALVDDADPESLKLDYWPDDDNDDYGDAQTPSTYTCFDLGPSGYVLNGDDCDDGTRQVNPSRAEVCGPDHVDDDCDGDIDEDDRDTTTYNWYIDDDADGYGLTGSTSIFTCQILDGYAPRAGDCNDARSAINPGTDELCNSSDIDEDCDGKVDEEDPETPAIDYFIDTDGDGYGDSGTVLSTCDTVTGRVTEGGDCNEGSTVINPGAFDDCENSVDDDCDGTIDNCSIGAVSMSAGDAIIDGDAVDLNSGLDLEGIGDINGDGNGDLAIGSYGYSTYTGKASIFFGPISGATTIGAADVDIAGPGFFDYFGWSIAGARDVNDDGATDLVVGAQTADAAYLFYGPVTADATAATADAKLTSTYTGDNLGWGVDMLGDYDGDGLDETVAMAPSAERTGTYSSGVIYVWSGPVTGTTAASTADYILGGAASNDRLTEGYSRAAIGDVNGDGLEDLAAASPYKSFSSSGLYGVGQLYLSYGGSLVAGTYDLSTSDDVTITGDSNDQQFGYGIANRADYDGDGYHDLVASGPGASTSGSWNGMTYIFYGPISGDQTVSDFDTRWEGERDDNSGLVVSAGDFNDDGKSDILVNAQNHSTPTCMYCGGAYLVLGGVEGDRSLEDDSFAILEGSAMFESAGGGITFIDDFDGDDWDEVAISSPYATLAGALYNAGTTSVFTGGNLYP